jgi:hypothetical protein
MAKKKEVVETAPIKPYEPPTCIRVTKDLASQFKVGQSVSLTVSGEVKGVSESYGDDGKYEVQLKKTKCSGVRSAENRADKAMKSMMGNDA